MLAFKTVWLNLRRIGSANTATPASSTVARASASVPMAVQVSGDHPSCDAAAARIVMPLPCP